MNDVSINSYMTTKEVAEALNISKWTVNEAVKKLGENNHPLFSEVKKNSQGGYLFNEAQVTAIKMELQNHSKVNALTPKTELEEEIFIQQAMSLLNNRINKLTAIVEAQEKTIDLMTPLAEFAARVGDSQTLLTIRQVSKILDLGYGERLLYKKLVEDKILMPTHEPYQEYMERGYFKIVEGSYFNGWRDEVTTTTKVTQKGLEFLSRKYKAKDRGDNQCLISF